MFLDLEVGFVMNELQSFLFGELGFARERAMDMSVPVTGRIECIAALGRPNVARRADEISSDLGRRDGDADGEDFLEWALRI
jgi:hypothetical protein